MDSAEGSSREGNAISDEAEIDAYGVPIGAFGASAPSEFFEILGRILAANGKNEYLQDHTWAISRLPE